MSDSGKIIKPNNESGNALWFILLAVALMALLTATVSRSTDTAEQSGNIERFRIQASDIMRHSAAIKEAIGNLRLRGIGENQMSFDVSFLSSSLYANANCTNTDCLVYGSAGGGISYRTPPVDWFDSTHEAKDHYGEWEFSGDNVVPGMRSGNPELIVYLGYLKQGLCAQINAMLDIPGIPVDANGFDPDSFEGTFTAGGTIDNMDGYESGCFQDDGNDRYFTYYQVLIKR